MPRETAAGERRVALVPEIVEKLVPGGLEVVVEPGAGASASFPDAAYADAGAQLADWADADVVVKVQKPSEEEAARLHDGQVLIGFLQPLTDSEGIERLAQRGVVAFAMESIPRITRAQPMDALSSQATVSGYKATLLAAERLPKFFPMLMTAAGTVAPAKVLVLGAGVAGLQAIATARRLGRGRDGLRRSARGARADREPRRELARPRRHRRGDRGRLRAGALRGAAAATAGGARTAAARVRRRDHDGADSRPPGTAPDPGGSGRARCAPAR